MITIDRKTNNIQSIEGDKVRASMDMKTLKATCPDMDISDFFEEICEFYEFTAIEKKLFHDIMNNEYVGYFAYDMQETCEHGAWEFTHYYYSEMNRDDLIEHWDYDEDTTLDNIYAFLIGKLDMWVAYDGKLFHQHLVAERIDDIKRCCQDAVEEVEAEYASIN